MTFPPTSRNKGKRRNRYKEGMTTMPTVRPIAAVIALAVALPAMAFAQTPSFTPDQRNEIGTIVREYLMSNPELLKDVIAEMEKREAAAEAEKHRAAVADNAALL